MSSMSTIHTTTELPQFYFLEAQSLFRFASRVDDPYKSILLEQLNNDIFQIIEADSCKWSTFYCAKPFFFAYTR